MTQLPPQSSAIPPHRKIGGWLIVFVITSSLGCVSLAIQITHSRTLANTLLVVFLLVSALLKTAMTLLRSRLVFPALMVEFAASLGLRSFYSYSIWKLHADPRYGTLAHDFTNQIASLAVMIVWLFYFHFSRRVRETFGQNLSLLRRTVRKLRSRRRTPGRSAGRTGPSNR
jgi:hypothetical protein